MTYLRIHKKFPPKFDPDEKEETLEIFVNRFILSLQLQNVQHEDVVFHKFHTLSKGRHPHGTLFYLKALSQIGNNLNNLYDKVWRRQVSWHITDDNF